MAIHDAYDTPRGRLTRIGDWELGHTLGRGAYAHVRIATHVNTRRQVACKILPALHWDPNIAADWNATLDAVEAHKEVVILKAFAGAKIPGVVELIGVLEEGGWTYMFMRLYTLSLSSISMPHEDRLRPFFAKLLHTLHTMHQIGISHDDLKRANIMVEKHGARIEPVLVDFGFSQFFPYGGHLMSLGGTFDYSCPEKVEDKPYDPRANDVWSTGILMMKALGLGHPYLDGTDGDSDLGRMRIAAGDPQWKWKREDKVPGGRGEVIMGMLEHNPSKRWTIPRILEHPYFADTRPDLAPLKLPPLRLRSTRVSRPVPPNVLHGVCFMAYVQHQFFLCETTQKIEKKLYGPTPC